LHLLVNALSIGSMSGQHVVYGFLRPLIKALCPVHQVTLLHYEGDTPPTDLLSPGVSTVAVADRFKHWAKRTLWEITRLPAIIQQQRADLVLSVSGALTPRCPVPQVVLCQNPWCYVEIAQQDRTQRFKAKLQRIGYGRAYRQAALMVYLSGHLRDLYRRDNASSREAPSAIAYVGLNESTYQAAIDLAAVPREPLTILSVSAMAHWKGATTLVRALALLRDRHLDAQLKLVGPWPDAGHRRDVEQLIDQLDLRSRVHILGRVSDDDLHKLYATSRVFCLMSHCESYGIPAAEAMAFGTPVISTDCCAIAEICSGAGDFGPVGDAEWTAAALHKALIDDDQWGQWSAAARARAATLTWDQCAKPLLSIPQYASAAIDSAHRSDRPALVNSRQR